MELLAADKVFMLAFMISLTMFPLVLGIFWVRIGDSVSVLFYLLFCSDASINSEFLRTFSPLKTSSRDPWGFMFGSIFLSIFV